MRLLLICTHLGTILTFRCMFDIFSCCYNSRTIQYIKFKFEALLSYTKATKYVKFQDVWCTGVRVGVFRISPIWMIVGQGPTVLAVGAGGVVWTVLLSIFSLLFLPLSGRRPDID